MKVKGKRKRKTGIEFEKKTKKSREKVVPLVQIRCNIQNEVTI